MDGLVHVQWRKSSHSSGNAACIEVADLDKGRAVRDSKDPSGPVLVLGAAQWAVFTAGVRAGELG